MKLTSLQRSLALPAGDAILNALGEGKQKQAFGGVVVARTTVLLAKPRKCLWTHDKGWSIDNRSSGSPRRDFSRWYDLESQMWRSDELRGEAQVGRFVGLQMSRVLPPPADAATNDT